MQQETIEMEIKYIKGDIEEMKADIKEIKDMFSKLDERYPTRREFKSVVGAIWFIATILGVIATILWFIK